MKAKYIILYFCAFWVLMSVLATIVEKRYIANIASDINNTVALAADMAITAVEASDEFFYADTGSATYNENGGVTGRIAPYTVMVPVEESGKTVGYRPATLYMEVASKVWDVNMNEEYAGIQSTMSGVIADSFAGTSGTNKEKIYNFMFGAGLDSKQGGFVAVDSPFGFYAQAFCKGNIALSFVDSIDVPLSEVLYTKEVNGKYELKIGYIPTLLRMGNDVISLLYSSNAQLDARMFICELPDGVGLDAVYNNSVTIPETYIKSINTTKDMYTQIAKWNNFNTTKKDSGVFSGTAYYTTPLSLGMTYLDADLLSYCFVNNMDLIMRSKYLKDDETTSIKHFIYEDAGVGLPTIGLADNRLSSNYESIVKKYNIINDGLFAFVKGDYSNSYYKQAVEGANNITRTSSVTIEYVSIDMFDSANDEILKQVFSAYKGQTETFAGYSSVAEYLHEMSTDIDVATGAKPEHKYIIVAKIDFYADVIVPYTTPLFKDFSAKYRDDGVSPVYENGELQYYDGMSDSNFMDMPIQEDTTNVNGVDLKKSDITGNAMYHYTTYFAVAP